MVRKYRYFTEGILRTLLTLLNTPKYSTIAFNRQHPPTLETLEKRNTKDQANSSYCTDFHDGMELIYEQKT